MTQKLNVSVKVKEFLAGKKNMFINDEFVNSVNEETFDTYNPSDGEVLAKDYKAEAEDVNLAVMAAKKAVEDGTWSRKSAAESENIMYKQCQIIEENKQELAEIDSLDNGKRIGELLENDIPNARGQFQYFAGWTTKIMGQTIPVSGSYFNYTRHEPVGVAGQI